MLLSGDYLAECKRAVTSARSKLRSSIGSMSTGSGRRTRWTFDDLILHTVRLLLEHPEAREYWQNKFRYVLIDEYQDTNHLQYLLASTLAGKWENICVVGDDDQSIYRFRGATIENILEFENQYSGARVIRLGRSIAPPRTFWRLPTR